MTCYVCEAGPWATRSLCDNCKAAIDNGVEEVVTYDLRLIHGVIFTDTKMCDGCPYLQSDYRSVDCMMKNNPYQCRGVQSYLDYASDVISDPNIMADFVAEVCHDDDLAHALVENCGNSRLRNSLVPLIQKWMTRKPVERVIEHAQQTYGDTDTGIRQTVTGHGSERNAAPTPVRICAAR
ncbi:MAG: hypothetical protein MJA28_06290 [Gammaproteobacteria bacterium]|nr:hypothetical protein [Gammaproteobacteria bacterium]